MGRGQNNAKTMASHFPLTTGANSPAQTDNKPHPCNVHTPLMCLASVRGAPENLGDLRRGFFERIAAGTARFVIGRLWVCVL